MDFSYQDWSNTGKITHASLHSTSLIFELCIGLRLTELHELLQLSVMIMITMSCSFQHEDKKVANNALLQVNIPQRMQSLQMNRWQFYHLSSCVNDSLLFVKKYILLTRKRLLTDSFVNICHLSSPQPLVFILIHQERWKITICFLKNRE